MAGRFIKLYDRLLQWEWFNHPNTLSLFIYLLLKANYKETVFHGIRVQRGQVLSSIPKIATDCGLSIQQTKTSLKHLISTGEITDQATAHYRIITISKYDEYQSVTDKLTDNQPTTNRQHNRQLTDNPTPCIEYIELQNDRNIESPSTRERTTAKRFVPPTKEEILDFCLEEGYGIDVDYLYDYYSSKGWKIGRDSMKDWKAAVRNWARREEKMQKAPAQAPRQVKTVTAQQYGQRDYSDITLDSQIASMLALEDDV